MSQHTPGPWTANTTRRAWLGGRALPATILCPQGHRLAVIDGEQDIWTADGNDVDEATMQARDHANARLIAAAPELLEACKAILAWADRECMPQGGKYDGPWEVIEAAIAKATDVPCASKEVIT